MKRTLICLAAVLSMLTCGSVYAVPQLERTAEQTVGDDAPVYDKRFETEEKPDFSADDVKRLFDYAGSADGVSLYLRSKDYEDRIWQSHGGKPENGTQLTEVQQREKELAEADISAAKKAGEAAAVFTDNGRPAAKLHRLSSDGGQVRYISERGRYIADVSETDGRLTAVYALVSSLDSSPAFLSDNGRKLTLMTADNKGTEEVLTYSGEEDGKRIYRGENGAFSWLTADMKHHLGTFTVCAENDSLCLFADMRTSLMGLENRKSGYIWWSSPIDASLDSRATELLAQRLCSSSVLNYGIPEKRNDSFTLRSGSSDDCRVTVTAIENGIRVDYDYSTGFRYPVEYTLEKDCLRASLRVSEIEETAKGKTATRVNILGSFGAAKDSEDGYFVIPDGSGALVRFGSKKSENTSSYTQRVYGRDITAVPTERGTVSEQICLPVYGIVKDGNGLLAVAEKGDSNALLSVETPVHSKTSYSLCSFIFTLRSTDTYYMGGSGSNSFTVFEKGNIKSDDIEMRYYPIDNEDADYADIAARYRQYLIEEKGVKCRTEENSSPLYVDFYGGVEKKQSVLGFPVTMKTPVTTFGQAQDILAELQKNGVDDMVVSYTNWTDRSIKSQVDTKASPSGTLGGKKAFNSLCGYMEDNDIKFYPVSGRSDFRSGGGFYTFTDTAVRVSGAYSRIVSYDRAYGIPDGFAKNRSLLSPDSFIDVFAKTNDSYHKRGLSGISLGDMTTVLYGDYGKKNISRHRAMLSLIDSYNRLDNESPDGILARSANAYALPYVSRLTDVPVSSSRFDIFDEDIPFYQLVLHGVIPYSTSAVNGSSEPADLILAAAANGSSLNYDMIWSETSKLKDTEFDVLYYANYKGWIKRAAEAYRLVEPLLAKVSGCTMTGHVSKNNGKLVTTTYSDGTEITVDFEKRTIESGGILYELAGIEREGRL